MLKRQSLKSQNRDNNNNNCDHGSTKKGEILFQHEMLPQEQIILIDPCHYYNLNNSKVSFSLAPLPSTSTSTSSSSSSSYRIYDKLNPTSYVCHLCGRYYKEGEGYDEKKNDDDVNKNHPIPIMKCLKTSVNNNGSPGTSHQENDDDGGGGDKSGLSYYCSSKCKLLAQLNFIGIELFHIHQEHNLHQPQKQQINIPSRTSDLMTLKRFFHKLAMSSTQDDNDLFFPSLIVSCIIYRNVMEHSNTKRYQSKQNGEKNKFSMIDFVQYYLDEIIIHSYDDEYNENNEDGEFEKVLECWTILLQVFPFKTTTPTAQFQYDSTKQIQTSINNDVQLFVHELSKSPNAFYRLQKFVKRNCLFPVSISDPIHSFIINDVLKLKDVELIDVIHSLYEMATKNAQTQNKKKNGPTTVLMKKTMVETEERKEYQNNDMLDIWRKATHLVQAATSHHEMDLKSLLGVELFEFITSLKKNVFVFDTKKLMKLKHSCVPNCIVEAVYDRISNRRKKLSVLALHDIHPEKENLTISKISNIDDDVNDRSMALRKFFGQNFVCRCPRCRLERKCNGDFSSMRVDETTLGLRGGNKNHEMPGTKITVVLKRLGDLAMQHGRYNDACGIYDICLENDPEEGMLGDILHAKAASFLERGLFMKAQSMWADAKHDCPNHDGINLQILKQEAYRMKESKNVKGNATTASFDEQTLTVRKDSFMTIIPKQCFVTKDDCPILTRNECSQVIEWAESAAKKRKNGWTTSRHYAVPTTDIPIHEVPIILEWFNSIFFHRLRPLLQVQFGVNEAGKGGCNIHIHDAFVVRYDARKQRHLPLHRDQSTHSFTIALNDKDEYDGGGTFVMKLKDSIRPSIGGVLSFRGDKLLHGGDPLLRGRRYIIVAFCYTNKQKNSNKSIVKQAKRQKLIHNTTEKEESDSSNLGSFSFGFKL